MKQIHLITDLQFGSTGKGLFAGYLANKHMPDTIVTAWGPNAGHTYISPKGEKMVNIALPNGIISPRLKRILLGPGSVINPELLQSEIERYAYWLGDGVDILIHEHAAVVQERHREEEASTGLGIGSTMKGVGAAVIEKIRRDVADKITAGRVLLNTPLEGYVVDAYTYQEALDRAEVILVEGAQGYSLSINHGFYPYTTSRDCTAFQIMSDCGIPAPSKRFNGAITVYGVARTYPIRVANRFKEMDDGSGTKIKVQVGWSGPGYADQQEISWESIGREAELTTVTRLPRRIFTFSMDQVKQAVRQNGVDSIFLNFCNYMPEYAVVALCRKIYEETGVRVMWTGWGAQEDNIHEVEA